MPHQIIEYSANLDNAIAIEELVGAMHKTAVGLESLPTAGIRTRAVRRDRFLVADGHPDNAFVNVSLRLAAGRTPDQKHEAGEALFGTLTDFVDRHCEGLPVSLSLEIQEIDPEFRWKQGNIRDFMARRAAGADARIAE